MKKILCIFISLVASVASAQVSKIAIIAAERQLQPSRVNYRVMANTASANRCSYSIPYTAGMAHSYAHASHNYYSDRENNEAKETPVLPYACIGVLILLFVYLLFAANNEKNNEERERVIHQSIIPHKNFIILANGGGILIRGEGA